MAVAKKTAKTKSMAAAKKLAAKGEKLLEKARSEGGAKTAPKKRAAKKAAAGK